MINYTQEDINKIQIHSFHNFNGSICWLISSLNCIHNMDGYLKRIVNYFLQNYDKFRYDDDQFHRCYYNLIRCILYQKKGIKKKFL